MYFSAVLFDMDGLLFDTERVAGEAAGMACREMGVTMRREILAQLYGANRIKGEAVMKQSFGPDFDFLRYTTLMHAHMQAVMAAEGGLRPMPGALAFLRWLKRQGLPTAVASSTKTETIHHNLRTAGFAAYFDAVVGGDMIENSKPAPDIFLAAARAAGAAPGACLALEDSPNGLRSAAAAGCVTVMVPDMTPFSAQWAEVCAAVFTSLYDGPDFVARYGAGGFAAKGAPLLYRRLPPFADAAQLVRAVRRCGAIDVDCAGKRYRIEAQGEAGFSLWEAGREDAPLQAAGEEALLALPLGGAALRGRIPQLSMVQPPA